METLFDSNEIEKARVEAATPVVSWKANQKGDSIEGLLLGYRQTKDLQERLVKIAVIDAHQCVSDGEEIEPGHVQIWLATAMLNRLFREQRPSPGISWVRIEYTGEVISKKTGNGYKTFAYLEKKAPESLRQTPLDEAKEEVFDDYIPF
jgi:hypothetical protein